MRLTVISCCEQVLEYPSFQRLRSVVGHGHSAHIYHLCQDPSGRCAGPPVQDNLGNLQAFRQVSAFIGLQVGQDVPQADGVPQATALPCSQVPGVWRHGRHHQPVGHHRHGVRQDLHRHGRRRVPHVIQSRLTVSWAAALLRDVAKLIVKWLAVWYKLCTFVRTWTTVDFKSIPSDVSTPMRSRYLAYADHLGIAIMDLESGAHLLIDAGTAVLPLPLPALWTPASASTLLLMLAPCPCKPED